jgi:hypothetical protein
LIKDRQGHANSTKIKEANKLSKLYEGGVTWW